MVSYRDQQDNFWSLPSVHIPLDLDQVDRFPLLAQALEVWRRGAGDGIPSTIDPLDMPPALIKGISLIEWREDAGDWYVRLASTLLAQGHGGPLTGARLADGLRPDQAGRMRERIRVMQESGHAALDRFEFDDRKGRIWSYVRLALPLSSDGIKRDRYALIFDPDTFGQRIDG
ncbi:MAG: hypothetical protein P1U88_00645 [Thalassobaculaceae bacterium]|nr:hypothetical protein [Thalassobaculaceae bacterium]